MSVLILMKVMPLSNRERMPIVGVVMKTVTLCCWAISIVTKIEPAGCHSIDQVGDRETPSHQPLPEPDEPRALWSYCRAGPCQGEPIDSVLNTILKTETLSENSIAVQIQYYRHLIIICRCRMSIEGSCPALVAEDICPKDYSIPGKFQSQSRNASLQHTILSILHSPMNNPTAFSAQAHPWDNILQESHHPCSLLPEFSDNAVGYRTYMTPASLPNPNPNSNPDTDPGDIFGYRKCMTPATLAAACCNYTGP